MNADLCMEFMQHLDRNGSLRVGNCPKKFIEFMERFAIDGEFHNFLRFYWPQRDAAIGPLRIHSSKTMLGDEINPIIAKVKFLCVGTAYNGDWLAIDFSTESCVPGFIGHETWEPWSKPLQDPRPAFEPVARSLESLLYRLVEGMFVPSDHYSTKEFNRFLEEEKKQLASTNRKKKR